MLKQHDNFRAHRVPCWAQPQVGAGAGHWHCVSTTRPEPQVPRASAAGHRRVCGAAGASPLREQLRAGCGGAREAAEDPVQPRGSRSRQRRASGCAAGPWGAGPGDCEGNGEGKRVR